MVEHPGAAVGQDEGRQVGLLLDLGVVFVGLDEGFDVVKAAGLGESPDGEFLGVAGDGGGGVVVGDGGVDLESFVRVVLALEK